MARLETVFRPVVKQPPTEADLAFTTALRKLLATMDQKQRQPTGAANDLFHARALLLAKYGRPQVVDAPGVAGTANRYMSPAFQFMNSHIHRVNMKP